MKKMTDDVRDGAEGDEVKKKTSSDGTVEAEEEDGNEDVAVDVVDV